MLSHHTEQILRYGQLIQYFTKVSEVYQKPLKDAYRRSNHVNPIPQILNTYERDYPFMMREANILCWSKYVTEGARWDPAGSGSESEVPKFFFRLQECQQLTSIEQLGLDYGIPDLEATVVEYFGQNHSMFYDISSFSTDCSIFFEPFSSLQLTLPSFQNEATIHHVCQATDKRQCRGKSPCADWVCLK